MNMNKKSYARGGEVKKGLCWYPGCDKTYEDQLRVKLTTKLKNTGEIEFRGCKEHFKNAYESEIKGFIQSLLLKEPSEEEVYTKPSTINQGHGHVRPLPNGAKARCGGPDICDECSKEQAQLEREK